MQGNESSFTELPIEAISSNLIDKSLKSDINIDIDLNTTIEPIIPRLNFQIEEPHDAASDNDALCDKNQIYKSNNKTIQNCTQNSSLFYHQLKLMLWKNYLLFKRNIRLTIFQILTPILMCLMLIWMQSLTDTYNTIQEIREPEIKKLNNITRCIYPDDCTTIGYGIVVSRYLYIKDYKLL